MSYRLEDLMGGDRLRPLLEQELSEAEVTIIESTIQPFIEITPTFPRSSLALPWQSRLGGMPYLPLGADYPLIEGKPAPLLAQINFADVPPLEGFPTSGILQFYLVDKPIEDWNHPWMNAETDTNLSYAELLELAGAKVLFFPDPMFSLEALITDFSFLPEFKHPIVSGIHTLRFEKKLAPLNESGLEYIEELQENSHFSENYDAVINKVWSQSYNDPIFKEIFDLLRGNMMKLSGYPTFRQDDPRIEIFPSVFRETTEPYQLLFSLGNQAAAALYDLQLYFLIRPSDLQNQIFSNVLFYNDR